MGLGERARKAFLAPITGDARALILPDAIEGSRELGLILRTHLGGKMKGKCILAQGRA